MSPGVIVGGGIAGLATAIFARTQGIDVALYERSSSMSCDDHLLWIAPNGVHLLARLGLLEEVRAMAVDQEAMIFATSQLVPLMTLTGEALRSSCAFPIVALRRRDLWQALADRWRAVGGEVHYGKSVAAIADLGERVEVCLEGDAAPRPAPWVIGADGMGSKVRGSIAPTSRVEYQGLRTWLGASSTPVAARYVGRTIEAWGEGTRFVLTSLDGDTVHFSAIERADVYESNAAPIPPATLARLAAAFTPFHPDVSAVLAAADPQSLVRCNFGVVSGLPRCSSGRVALIGDAAHGMPPNMGQGASLGLEDALWIIHELTTGSAEVSTAFDRYDAARRRRVGEMRQLANAMNGLFQPKSRWASRLRDGLAALVPDVLTARRMGHLYQPALPVANDGKLPGLARS
jgi:2-polyprenyl-6-methoxyphenol hydroxylase-like FAD-dependent oxidoreductase